MLHVPLAVHQVCETMRRVPSSVRRDDLSAVALLALLTAARDVDAASAARFAEQASIRIRGALVEELRSTDWAVRAACPRDPAAARARLDAVLAQFPDAAEAAEALARAAGPGADPAARRHAGDPDPRGRVERVACIALAVEELPHRLRHVARGYFIEQRPMADLAAEIGASEARATELRTEALVLLRDALAAAMGPDRPATTEVDGGAHGRRRLAYTRAVAVQYAARRSLTATSREQLATSA
ncbi:MAG TPA: FliA/WhiG family RNA polymerase sigma factor [Nocardioides sp.]|nr:FliA/WhiG family RNA polymerase sigma factor [Nocardioides sp.]